MGIRVLDILMGTVILRRRYELVKDASLLGRVLK